MNWKQENKRERYIDSITEEEATQLLFLALGKPKDFKLLNIEAYCNGNNIPHVKIFYKVYSPEVGEYYQDYIGIFESLNVYNSSRFASVYCQKEIFKLSNELGFE